MREREKEREREREKKREEGGCVHVWSGVKRNTTRNTNLLSHAYTSQLRYSRMVCTGRHPCFSEHGLLFRWKLIRTIPGVFAIIFNRFEIEFCRRGNYCRKASRCVRMCYGLFSHMCRPDADTQRKEERVRKRDTPPQHTYYVCVSVCVFFMCLFWCI